MRTRIIDKSTLISWWVTLTKQLFQFLDWQDRFQNFLLTTLQSLSRFSNYDHMFLKTRQKLYSFKVLFLNSFQIPFRLFLTLSIAKRAASALPCRASKSFLDCEKRHWLIASKRNRLKREELGFSRWCLSLVIHKGWHRRPVDVTRRSAVL